MMAEFQYKGPMDENAVKEIFAVEGIDYDTRNIRYHYLLDTMFEKTPAKYWIAYNSSIETGKPIAVQGIGPYKNVYLLSGLKSYGKEYAGKLDPSETEGAGQAVSEKVIDMHGDRPIIGLAQPRGLPVFEKQGFLHIEVQDGKVVNQEDIPEDVKEIIEASAERRSRGDSDVTPIRKIYYKPVAEWFYIIQGN
jgi:hypothetical protein